MDFFTRRGTKHLNFNSNKRGLNELKIPLSSVSNRTIFSNLSIYRLSSLKKNRTMTHR